MTDKSSQAMKQEEDFGFKDGGSQLFCGKNADRGSQCSMKTDHWKTSVTRCFEKAKSSGQPEQPTQTSSDSTTSPASLKFAGAEFSRASSDEPGVLRFVSDSESAVSSAKALDNMGLTGWQKVGSAEVSIRNSGPPGESVQIRLRVPHGQDIRSVTKPLSSIGIEICN